MEDQSKESGLNSHALYSSFEFQLRAIQRGYYNYLIDLLWGLTNMPRIEVSKYINCFQYSSLLIWYA